MSKLILVSALCLLVAVQLSAAYQYKQCGDQKSAKLNGFSIHGCEDNANLESCTWPQGQNVIYQANFTSGK